jgi:hypothetical protein
MSALSPRTDIDPRLSYVRFNHAPHLVGLRGMCRARSVNSGNALGALTGFPDSIGEPATYSKEAVLGLTSVILSQPEPILEPGDRRFVLEAQPVHHEKAVS